MSALNENNGLFEKMLNRTDANYIPIAVYHLNEEKEIMLGDQATKRICRFCGRSEPEVSFKKGM